MSMAIFTAAAAAACCLPNACCATPPPLPLAAVVGLIRSGIGSISSSTAGHPLQSGFHPRALGSSAAAAAAASADDLPLPAALLAKDALGDMDADAPPPPEAVLGEEEAAAMALAGMAVLGNPAFSQQHVPSDGIATLPLGQSLRQEAQLSGGRGVWAFETGKLARLANGSCLLRAGGTSVLAAAACQLPAWSRRDVLNIQFEVCWAAAFTTMYVTLVGGHLVGLPHAEAVCWRAVRVCVRSVLQAEPPLVTGLLCCCPACPPGTQVDYREKLYAVARIPSTYNKREGAAKEHEVLAGRRIGRALRPLFPKGFVFESAVSARGGTLQEGHGMGELNEGLSHCLP